MSCPCGSGKDLGACCGPYISDAAKPPTAEALMRSRFTAFTQGAFDYIGKTFALPSQADAHAKGANEWASSGTFKRLKVVSTTQGGEGDRRGLVEFVATYTQGGETWDHHEESRFERNANGHWAYAGGNGHRHREGEVPSPSPPSWRRDRAPCRTQSWTQRSLPVRQRQEVQEVLWGLRRSFVERFRPAL